MGSTKTCDGKHAKARHTSSYHRQLSVILVHFMRQRLCSPCSPITSFHAHRDHVHRILLAKYLLKVSVQTGNAENIWLTKG